MRILVLSRTPALYSTSRLVLAGRARGHEVDVIDPMQMQIVVARREPSLRWAGHALARYHAVIPRIGASITRYGIAVMRELEDAGTIALNGSQAIALARDKVRSLSLLARQRLRVPRTVCIRGPEGADEALELVGGCPVIVKLQQGTQGVGTMLAESRAAALSLLQTLWAMGQDVLLQEYVGEAAGSDVRALVVGTEVVAAMRRTAPEGDFRSNLHRGAQGEPLRLPRRYRAAAIKAARTAGLEVSGVDMLETADGPVLLEVNCSPGLEGIEVACETDVATPIIARAEQLAEDAKKRRRNGRAKTARAPAWS